MCRNDPVKTACVERSGGHLSPEIYARYKLRGKMPLSCNVNILLRFATRQIGIVLTFNANNLDGLFKSFDETVNGIDR